MYLTESFAPPKASVSIVFHYRDYQDAMGLKMRIPKFKLQVEGAEGREAKLENDDLLPTPLENR